MLASICITYLSYLIHVLLANGSILRNAPPRNSGQRATPSEAHPTPAHAVPRHAHQAAMDPPHAEHALLCEVEPLPPKHLADELRGQKDLQAFAESAAVLLDLHCSTAEDIVARLLEELVDIGSLPPGAVDEATRALLGRGAGVVEGSSSNVLDAAREGEEGEGTGQWHFHKNILGRGFIIPFARINGLDAGKERVVAIARLATASNLGVINESLIRFVVIVLGPLRDIKEVKAPFELARSFASCLEDDDFYFDARSAVTSEAVRDAIRSFLFRKLSVDLNERDSEPDAGDMHVQKTFARTGKFAGGLIADIKRRYKPSVYKSDWVDGLTDPHSLLKYMSTTLWLFFAIIMPTIAFGALDDDNTRLENETTGAIGVIETIVSQAFAGIAFSVFSGQPLTIVMTTAPITVFIDVLFRWCKSLSIPFLPFYAWTGLWTALILIILVVTDACYIMKYCGQFTEEIFAFLIAALFISEYIKPLIHVAEDYSSEVFLLAFLLATGTYLLANALLVFRRSFLLKPIIRQLLSEFGVPIAIIVMTGVRQAFKSVEAELLPVPDKTGIVTTSGRSWLVSIFDIEVKHIFLASVSGVLLATLFFLDQNISSMLVNKMENKLKKGPGYYLDLVVVSAIIVVQSILGLPWTHAALPHSPLHARQLADVEEYEEFGRRYERVIKARETRLTGFVTHLLIGLSILAKDALGEIPLSVLYGFFLFLGIGTLDGLALWDRVLLIFTQREKYPPNHYVRRVPILRIHLYTAIQLLLLVLLWFVKSNFYMGDTVFNTGLLFPFVIALFIPVRMYILPRIFKTSELLALGKEDE